MSEKFSKFKICVLPIVTYFKRFAELIFDCEINF